MAYNVVVHAYVARRQHAAVVSVSVTLLPHISGAGTGSRPKWTSRPSDASYAAASATTHGQPSLGPDGGGQNDTRRGASSR